MGEIILKALKTRKIAKKGKKFKDTNRIDLSVDPLAA